MLIVNINYGNNVARQRESVFLLIKILWISVLKLLDRKKCDEKIGRNPCCFGYRASVCVSRIVRCEDAMEDNEIVEESLEGANVWHLINLFSDFYWTRLDSFSYVYCWELLKYDGIARKA